VKPFGIPHCGYPDVAMKDLKSIPSKERERIVARIDRMEADLQGDVKKLTNHTPEYRIPNA